MRNKLMKEEKMEQEYYMGLDMGTGSLGWAITDTEYHILRRHGKALWGVRLFESALTAEEVFGQPEGDWIEETGEFRSCRNCFLKKSVKWIWDFFKE